MKRKKGFTLIELLVVVAIIALLISILLPSLARARELAKRAVCAANLSGMGKAYHIYANVNFDLFPIAPHTIGTAVVWQGKCGEKGSARNAGAATAIADYNSQNGAPSTTANPWMLVRDGDVGPGSFYCPSSTDQKDLTDEVSFYHDFTGWNTVSYGFQIPFTQAQPTTNGPRNLAIPTNTMDGRVAIAADKGPWSNAGATLGSNRAGQGGVADAGANPQSNFQWPGLQGKPDQYRPFNSPNHGGRDDGEGQNVLFPDGHAEFARRPDVGMNADNIYTQALPQVSATSPGTQPTNNLTPLTGTDSVIYP